MSAVVDAVETRWKCGSSTIRKIFEAGHENTPLALGSLPLLCLPGETASALGWPFSASQFQLKRIFHVFCPRKGVVLEESPEQRALSATVRHFAMVGTSRENDSWAPLSC